MHYLIYEFTLLRMALPMSDPCGPFSGQELLLAFRFVMSETEAVRLAKEWSPAGAADGLKESKLGSPDAEDPGFAYSDDLLLLLSLVSDELDERVQRCRAEMGPGPDILDDIAWRERRATMIEALRRAGRFPPPSG